MEVFSIIPRRFIAGKRFTGTLTAVSPRAGKDAMAKK
jgi:hypothetical protein